MDISEVLKKYNNDVFKLDLKNRKPSLICDRLIKIYDHGLEAKKKNNHKEAYIYFKRWIRCAEWLLNQRVDKNKDFITYQTINKHVTNEKIEEVKGLVREATTNIEIELKVKNHKKSNDEIEVDLPLDLPEIPNDEPQPKRKDEIQCAELFRILSQYSSSKASRVLLIDVRSKKDYSECRISFDNNMINIPEQYIEPKRGITNYKSLLDEESTNRFNRRSSQYVDIIVLVDSNSSADNLKSTSAIAILKKTLEDKDSFSESKRIVILKGGFKEWKETFPSYVISPFKNIPSKKVSFKDRSSSDNLDNSKLDDFAESNQNSVTSPIMPNTRGPGPAVKMPIAPYNPTQITSINDNTSNSLYESLKSPYPPLQINGAYILPNNNTIPHSDRQLMRKNNIRESKVIVTKLQPNNQREISQRPVVDRTSKPGKRPPPNTDETLKNLEIEIEQVRALRTQKEREIDCLHKDKDPWTLEQYRIYVKREEELIAEAERILQSKTTKLYPQIPDLPSGISAMSLGTRSQTANAKVDLSEEKENIQATKRIPEKVKPQTPKPPPQQQQAPQRMEVDEEEDLIYKAPLKKDHPPPNTGLKRSYSSPDLLKKDSRRSVPVVDRSQKPTGLSENTNTVKFVSHLSSKDREQRMEPVYASNKQHPGITGLKNLGNSCYMNSIIQCLSNTVCLAKYFNSNIYTDHLHKTDKQKQSNGYVAEEVAQVIKALWCGQYKSISPRDLKVVVGQYKLQFENYDQQDSHEFLMFLLDWMHNDLKQKSKISSQPLTTAEKEWEKSMDGQSSIISQLFFGQLRSTISCMSCGKNSETYETFNSLTMSLPSSNKCTLDDCVKKFVSDQKVSGWKCPNCKVPREVVKKFDIAKLPLIIVIHLNRFGDTGGWLEKKNTAVDFPLNNFDLRKYLVQDKEINNMYSTYNLYAMSNHYGTMDGGHYTAYCKSNAQNKWYKYDDHTVTEIPPSQVKNQSNSAYLLFYTMAASEQYLNS